MNPILEKLHTKIDDWFKNLSKQDLEDIEYGRSFHIMCGEKGRVMRAILFLERSEI